MRFPFTLVCLLAAAFFTKALSDRSCEEELTSDIKMKIVRDSLKQVKIFFPTCRDADEDSAKCGKSSNALAHMNLAIDTLEGLTLVGNKDCPTCPSRSGYKPRDCTDVLNDGHKTSGIYTIWPVNRLLGNSSINVYCDMDTDGGGWTVIQRRGDFNRSTDYFFKEWNSYKKGFGDLSKDFWLGNDNIFTLTNQRLYSIRFDLGDFQGNKAYALYDEFWIADEINKYRLHIQDYSGTAGDSMVTKHNNQFFTTKDQRNDNYPKNCALHHKGAWWYNSCFDSSLNGQYFPRGIHETNHEDGIHWSTWKGLKEILDTTEMKIRPINVK